MKAQPLVSVVTPVHNDAELIEECIESVLGQTYSNWSYTIVDNASTDATPEIAARYAARESRIRHLRFDELVGSNQSHNRAFRAIDAESAYCKLVEADDWLFPGCLQAMVDVAEASESVGIVSAYRLVETKVDLGGLSYRSTVFPGVETLRRSLLGEISVIGGPSATLIRSRHVRASDPFYDERYFHSDTEAAYRILAGNDFGFVHQVLTFARRQPGRQIDSSFRMNTFAPEYLCFLLRYGALALDPDQYRDKLRGQLRAYVRWHTRQAVRPSRLKDADFFRLHGQFADEILRLGAEEARVAAAMRYIKLLLSRKTWSRRAISRHLER